MNSDDASGKFERQKEMIRLRRNRIFQAARQAVDESGLNGLQMRDVARRCGYTQGALYAYYKNKEAMLEELSEDYLKKLAHSIKSVKISKELPEQEISVKVMAWLGFFIKEAHAFDVICGGQSRLSPSSYKKLRVSWSSCQDTLMKMGVSKVKAEAEIKALCTYALGLLLMINQDSNKESTLNLKGYVDQLVLRIQPDLFESLDSKKDTLAQEDLFA